MSQIYTISLDAPGSLPEGVTYAVTDDDLRAFGAEHGVDRVGVFIAPDRGAVALLVVGEGDMTPGVGLTLQRVLEAKGLPTGGHLEELADEDALARWALGRR